MRDRIYFVVVTIIKKRLIEDLLGDKGSTTDECYSLLIYYLYSKPENQSKRSNSLFISGYRNS
jgi:hypothetical protein